MIWWEQLHAFMWLRWRIKRSQFKRASAGSVILETIFAAMSVFAGISSFLIGLVVGYLLLPKASNSVVMLVWDAAVAGFLLMWLIGLVSELQRSEMLSLEKFLHLPVSLSSVFLMNYISSLYSPEVTLFLPGMAGVALGLLFSKGSIILLLFPLVATFFLMVTALAYQFRGWLASLMQNKRRRRTIVTFLTIMMVLLFQLPNLLTFGRFGGRPNHSAIRALEGKTRLDDAQRIARTANMIIPAGWLPYGVVTLLEGRVMPSFLGAVGLALIAAISLRRSYKTTLRLYTGHFKAGKPKHRAAALEKFKAQPKAATFLERVIPGISDQASAITVACIRSLTRAPEAKMMLLTPILFTVIFGGGFLRGHSNPPQGLRPMMAAGLTGFILLGIGQLAGNQFGFDRNGFRVFVLAGASRKDILLGKNLAMMPFALGLGMIGLTVLQFAYPMRVDHWIATIVQMISMYLVFCVLMNLLSILAPAAISFGSLRPVRPKGMAVLIHLLFFFLLLPVTLALTLIPLGIEYFLPNLPVYLVLTLAACGVIAYLYTRILDMQGRLLHNREQQILETVAARVE